MPMRSGQLIAGAMLLSACTGTAESRSDYFVSYADATAYRGHADEEALDRCAVLDGADRGGQQDSLPPSVTLVFQGSESERDRLDDCLRALPNVRILGPANEGDLTPPRLVG